MQQRDRAAVAPAAVLFELDPCENLSFIVLYKPNINLDHYAYPT